MTWLWLQEVSGIPGNLSQVIPTNPIFAVPIDLHPWSETVLLFSFLIGVNLRSSAATGFSDLGDVVR